MSEDEKLSPEELERRKRWFEDWFDGYVRNQETSVFRAREYGTTFACPCCRCLTLGGRGGFEICPVCFWEDDGQDDKDASVVRGGPNGALSLEQARRNFAIFGACDEPSKQHVRPPIPEEKPDAG
jgi:Cysteine-rich CPCC